MFPYNKGGKEKRLYEVTTELAAAGHAVHVYTMKWWEGDRNQIFDGVCFHAICTFRPLYSGSRRSMRQALLFGLATLKLLFRRFDVMDVDHMPFFPLFSARLVCWLRRRKLVGTWHEVWGRAYWRQYLGLPGWLAAAVERLATRMPDEIITVSDHTARRLRDQLGASCPIHTLPLGVGIRAIDAAGQSFWRPDVMFAGRLLPNKNVDVLLRAVAFCAANGRPVDCLIVGEGPERRPLERLAAALGVSDHTRFIDFAPYEELYGLMKSAGVLVLPSIREGFGLIVLEANACGLPVITVRHPDNAAQHLIVEGRNGLIVDLDPKLIAEAIVDVLEHRDAMSPRAHVDGLRPAVDWTSVAASLGDLLLGTAPSPPAFAVGVPAQCPSGRQEIAQ